MKKREKKCSMLKSQVSFEYIVIMGFVTFAIISVLGIAVYYGNSIGDSIKMIQLNNCANKIISTSESVFYSGSPSKATITCYLPENIRQIEILENSIFFTISTSSGTAKIAFSSNVPIAGSLNSNQGLKKIQIEAQTDTVMISQG